MRQAERDERDKAREVTRRNASRMAMEDLQVMPTPLQASTLGAHFLPNCVS